MKSNSRNRCAELDEWLFGASYVPLSQEKLMKKLFKQHDWCKKRFPESCTTEARGGVESRSSEPSSDASQSRRWEGGDFDAVPRWDNGDPLDPAVYPDAYRNHRARRAVRYWGPSVFPINPASPRIPQVGPVRVPIFLRPVVL
jgi:hypothetical protein